MTDARPRGALTVTLVVVCQGFNMLTVGGLAMFLPLIREDLGMSFSQAGLLSAVSTFTYAARSAR
jgi:cyanate permease